MVALDKRPKGRPSGSKNKPKSAMDMFKPIILIISTGMNIIDAIIDFSHKKDVSIAVHHASGAISEVNIFNPLPPSNCWSFQGNLHMFYLSGFYTKSISPFPPNNVPYSSFNIQFSMDWVHQTFGGLVGRKLIAAEPVHVFASIFKENECEGVVNPIANPNVQSVMMSTHVTHCVADAFVANTDNTVYHPSFSIGASTSSSSMNDQPLDASPGDVNMLYWNDPTN
ncbi:AT-hook motif nuclear-localized protein 28 [Cajanus cajan]|uniref:PPC domain-containing protein n=2 Tax=Cajanus cajan TaxID=3821 RepID=A0A151QW75_CAJCA|nr:AT-hook motif nuclear-localized protein 28 [Cajanus cajan]KYP34560.1 hypothetical protein KK1_044469 [Cajanus cajan]KYP76562.1 hypothetical protein KK1_020809 [Cajanus cajan]